MADSLNTVLSSFVNTVRETGEAPGGADTFAEPVDFPRLWVKSPSGTLSVLTPALSHANGDYYELAPPTPIPVLSRIGVQTAGLLRETANAATGIMAEYNSAGGVVRVQFTRNAVGNWLVQWYGPGLGTPAPSTKNNQFAVADDLIEIRPVTNKHIEFYINGIKYHETRFDGSGGADIELTDINEIRWGLTEGNVNPVAGLDRFRSIWVDVAQQMAEETASRVQLTETAGVITIPAGLGLFYEAEAEDADAVLTTEYLPAGNLWRSLVLRVAAGATVSLDTNQGLQWHAAVRPPSDYMTGGDWIVTLYTTGRRTLVMAVEA